MAYLLPTSYTHSGLTRRTVSKGGGCVHCRMYANGRLRLKISIQIKVLYISKNIAYLTVFVSLACVCYWIVTNKCKRWHSGNPVFIFCYSVQLFRKHFREFLVNETNRRNEFQFYWCYDSTCFRQLFCPSSGVLSCTSALVHFADLMTVCYQEQDGTAVPSCSW